MKIKKRFSGVYIRFLHPLSSIIIPRDEFVSSKYESLRENQDKYLRNTS